jgi:hypothetical protein
VTAERYDTVNCKGGWERPTIPPDALWRLGARTPHPVVGTVRQAVAESPHLGLLLPCLSVRIERSHRSAAPTLGIPSIRAVELRPIVDVHLDEVLGAAGHCGGDGREGLMRLRDHFAIVADDAPAPVRAPRRAEGGHVHGEPATNAFPRVHSSWGDWPARPSGFGHPRPDR